MKICYQKKNFQGSTLEVIEQANLIVDEYAEQGFDLTLRQLYYQFVARDMLSNTQKSYSRLGSIVNDGRLAGMIDWDRLEDRTRNLQGTIHTDSPAAAISDAAKWYRRQKWEDQPYRVEVWVEKEALIGVFSRICDKLDVDYFACRGYVSQSEMWRASIRMKQYRTHYDQQPVILHFGDHDPSGIDMTRDIEDRFSMFGADVIVERLALNMDQVEEHRPPPNPAKSTDSRFDGYRDKFGTESWELDALNPSLLSQMVENEVFEYRDSDLWAKAIMQEDTDLRLLRKVSEKWDDVVENLS